jgi:hypothetical protein
MAFVLESHVGHKNFKKGELYIKSELADFFMG